MSSTVKFIANAATITLIGYSPSGADKTFSNRTDSDDPVVREVAQKFATSGTTSGTVTLTAA